MKIVFIRHLKTPGNEKRQYIGRTDEELADRAVKDFLLRFTGACNEDRARCRESGRTGIVRDRSTSSLYPPAQHIIASPMKRCIRTAELIYPGQEIRTEPMLRECDFGEYEQKTYEELRNEPEYIRWIKSGGMTAFPGGEDPAAFRRRCMAGAEKWIGILLRKEADSAAFIVHGGTVMAVLSELSEDTHGFYHWQVENGGGYAAEVRAQDWENGRKVLRNVKRLS